MADRDINYTNQDKIHILRGDLSSSGTYYNDLLFEKLGTSRKSEVIGLIGDTNIPYKELINNYLASL
jgi:hypothetical protein